MFPGVLGCFYLERIGSEVSAQCINLAVQVELAAVIELISSMGGRGTTALARSGKAKSVNSYRLFSGAAHYRNQEFVAFVAGERDMPDKDLYRQAGIGHQRCALRNQALIGIFETTISARLSRKTRHRKVFI